MKYILWAVGIVFGLFVLLWLRAIWCSISRNKKIYKEIEPALKAVEENSENADELVKKFAANASTRNRLLEFLTDMDKADIFPEEYQTKEKLAESDLVIWLMHPNELRSEPDEIELMHQTEVTREGKKGKYFLFRFKVNKPHWAADSGWMSGVSGPFWDDGSNGSHGSDTFSELESYEAKSNEEHLAFLKKSAKKRGLVMPS